MTKRSIFWFSAPSMAYAGSALAALLTCGPAIAAQVVVNGPPGTAAFGTLVTVLPNGNFLATDPRFDAPGPIADVGAVFLYQPDGVLISTLTGSTAGDRVGSGGVTVLSNGNFVVGSPRWVNGAAVDSGALTFGSGSAGISGTVSAVNSLVGSTAGDSVGKLNSLVVLPNGNYLVVSSGWDNGTAVDAGAVTFGSGAVGISGVVSPANSLVGTTAGDLVGDDGFGNDGVVVLSNGNYVVRSPDWDNGAAVDAGAATFGLGSTGVSGAISRVNSLVGGSANDEVGSSVTALSNGNYVVGSSSWDNASIVNTGAATFGLGTGGVSGEVTPANSLIGSVAEDRIGGRVTALSNGNYVVGSSSWDNGSVIDAGAATFGSGVDGVTGVISPANSLVGTTAGDGVGGCTALSNGNYAVVSPNWDNATTINAGAVTFGSGTTGIIGAVSPANSLVGSSPNDSVGGHGVRPLVNGNYAVVSPDWDNATTVNTGAVTFGSGTTGIIGAVSPANSLVGSSTNDFVGRGGVAALLNGNYVVSSSSWSNGNATDVGAVTFGSGTVGINGAVSPANSLIGSVADDQVGGVTPLSNGNYVVSSSEWDHGNIVNAGAATFGSGATGISGVVSPANSLVGSSAFDRVGTGITPLANGSYVVRSPDWSNQGLLRAGAATFGLGSIGIAGVVSSTNSLVGSTAGDSVGNDFSGVTALSDGSYVVGTSRWDHGTVVDAGAATYGSGTSGITGVISPANSIVGSRSGDFQFFFFTAVSNGNYVLTTEGWDNGPIANAGAITLGLAGGSVVGPLTTQHSVLGPISLNSSTRGAYDPVRNQLIVGQYASNRVVLHRTGVATRTSITGSTPDPSPVGQPAVFSAIVSALPNGPADGVVTFSAGSGETCTDASATKLSDTSAAFACGIAFADTGASTVIAEYTGSIIHAYSRSSAATHTTVEGIFFDGFEAP